MWPKRHSIKTNKQYCRENLQSGSSISSRCQTSNLLVSWAWLWQFGINFIATTSWKRGCCLSVYDGDGRRTRGCMFNPVITSWWSIREGVRMLVVVVSCGWGSVVFSNNPVTDTLITGCLLSLGLTMELQAMSRRIAHHVYLRSVTPSTVFLETNLSEPHFGEGPKIYHQGNFARHDICQRVKCIRSFWYFSALWCTQPLSQQCTCLNDISSFVQ